MAENDFSINDVRTIAGDGYGTPPTENGTPMDRSIGDGPTMRPQEERGGRGAFAPGDVIAGRYVVEKVLGEGGMGIVYQCLDKVGGVSVAVKCLPPEVSRNADEMEDIRANYRLVSDLHHPNIAGARTLEVDVSTGDYYLVMDLARGTSLKRWMRRNTQATMAAKLAILRQVAAALDYAHSRKVIHRDVKPENVMVDDEGVVKVLDFGLAAQIRSSQSRTSNSVTSKGGTPGYKSPEQWRGKPQREPADVYSFGVMAYWMFAGALPFDGDDPVVLGHAVLTEPVEPITGLPAHMNAALVKALAKEPNGRFASCGAVVDALEGQVGSRVPRDRTGGSRSRTAAKIIFAAAALALAVVGGWWLLSGREDSSRASGTTGAAGTNPPTQKRYFHPGGYVKNPDGTYKKNPDGSYVWQNGSYKDTPPPEPDPPRGSGTPAASSVKEKPQSLVEAERAAEKARNEAVELTSLRTRINIKVSDAREKLGRISEFRADPDGLETHIASADAQLKTISSIDTPATLEAARSALELADKAETQISLDLDWLRKNKAGRDAAKAAEVEIKNLLEGDTATFKAERYAIKSYREGADLRARGQSAFKKGDFAEAGKLLGEAKAKFAEAAREAKAFFVKTALQSAQTYFDAEKWQDCVAEANKVLGWDTNNAAAAKLKKDAESHQRVLDSQVSYSDVIHTVSRGEVLSTIVKKYNVKRSTIIAANPGLNPNRLLIGQRIRIPNAKVSAIGVDGDESGSSTNRPTFVPCADAHDKVQLWENGPYWATTNIGVEKPVPEDPRTFPSPVATNAVAEGECPYVVLTNVPPPVSKQSTIPEESPQLTTFVKACRDLSEGMTKVSKACAKKQARMDEIRRIERQVRLSRERNYSDLDELAQKTTEIEARSHEERRAEITLGQRVVYPIKNLDKLLGSGALCALRMQVPGKAAHAQIEAELADLQHAVAVSMDVRLRAHFPDIESRVFKLDELKECFDDIGSKAYQLTNPREEDHLLTSLTNTLHTVQALAAQRLREIVEQ